MKARDKHEMYESAQAAMASVGWGQTRRPKLAELKEYVANNDVDFDVVVEQPREEEAQYSDTEESDVEVEGEELTRQVLEAELCGEAEYDQYDEQL